MRNTASTSLLPFCAALAAGEFAASFASNYAELWSLVLLFAVIVVLFGYGLSICGWRLLAVAIFGVSLYFFSSVPEERVYRIRPWLRDRPRQRQRVRWQETALLRRVKTDLARRVGVGLESDDETVPLSRAILLGERHLLTPRMKRLFIESGTMHVFAISGLHVMAVAEVLTYALAALLVPRRLCGLFAVPVLWGYVALIGFAPSAVRAALMASFSFAAPAFWRRPDGLRSWSLAFLAVHLVNPLIVVNVGNVLSFVVMLAISIASDWSRDLAGWKRLLVVTLVAWVVGVPISAHVFGRVTPGGLLANLVLIGTAKLTVVTGAVGVLSSYVLPVVSAHLNNLSALSVRAMIFIADAVARVPGANFETGNWSFPACALWYVVLVVFAVVVLRVRERRKSL